MSVNIISKDNKMLSIDKKYIDKYPNSLLSFLSSMMNMQITIEIWSSDIIEMVLNFYKTDELLINCDKKVSTTIISLVIGYFLLPDDLKVRFYSSEEDLKDEEYSEDEYQEYDYEEDYNIYNKSQKLRYYEDIE